MNDENEYLGLIAQARKGDALCLNRLTELIRPQLAEFVYRETLREDVTQDVVQESLLEMVQVLGKLEKEDRFWPWLRKIATGKISAFYQKEKRQHPRDQQLPSREDSHQTDHLETMISQELQGAVRQSIQALKPHHRHILNLRCYEKLEYTEIAQELGCSAFSVRQKFCRAKKALQKQLSRNGLKKGTLLTALIVFGKLTAHSQASAAQVTLTAGTLETGSAAVLVTVATTNTAIASLAAAGLLATGVGIHQSREQSPPPVESSTVTPIAQVVPSKPFSFSNRLRPGEYEFHFPLGPREPVFLRIEFREPHQTGYSCQWLHNYQGSFFYDRQRSRVFQANCRPYHPDLSVMRLPTDPSELHAFLNQVEGRESPVPCLNRTGSGLWVVVKPGNHHNHQSDTAIQTGYNRNALIEEVFQNPWPVGTEILDARDSLHLQGWAYFQVNGQIRGQTVTGQGQIPFTVAHYPSHHPWLQLQVGEHLSLIDSDTWTGKVDTKQAKTTRFPGGSFFQGLSRPWMGLHTIDSIRRDAARKEIAFHTQPTDDPDRIEVTLINDEYQIIYTISLQQDWIECIEFRSPNEELFGEMHITYHSAWAGKEPALTVPQSGKATVEGRSQGILWLFQLWAENDHPEMRK